MKILEILAESKSAPLFHGTSLKNCDSIIRANKLGKHKYDVISLSRSYEFAERFAQERAMGGLKYLNVAVLELDQEKLSQRYRIEPYNDPASADEDGVYFRLGKFSNQMEESVFGAITPLSRYLTKIIINNLKIELPKAIAMHPLLYEYSTKTFVNKDKYHSRPPPINAKPTA